MKRFVLILVFGVACLPSIIADAVVFAPRTFGAGYGGRYGGAVYGAGYNRGYGYGGNGGMGGNTAGGAMMGAGQYMQGMSSVMRANADAMNTYEDTRSKYIDNRVKWQKSYYEMQGSYAAHKEQENAKETAARDKWLANRPSSAPARLSASQLDQVTGHIAWPDALQSDDMAGHRKKIEELFQIRATTSNGSKATHDIKLESDQMLLTLKSHINDIPPNEYISARKFLDSLAYETQFAAR